MDAGPPGASGAGGAVWAKPLPGSFEEFRRLELTGSRAFRDKLRLPLEFARLVHSALLSRLHGSWDEIAGKMESKAARALEGVGRPAFTDEAFVAAFERATGSRFTSGNSVRLLVDGPASFEARFALMERARRSIHLMSWAVYDDETGYRTVRTLLEKAAAGVEVRVIVDEQVSERSGHGCRLLPYLEENGIPVIRWRSDEAERRHDGLHRKLLVVDSEAAIAGGMNVGDSYSHLGGSERWRDTDVLIEGPAAVEGERLFVRTWNAQIGRMERDLAYELASARFRGEEGIFQRPEEGLVHKDAASLRKEGFVRLPEPREPSGSGAAPVRVALIEHVPGATGAGAMSLLLAVEAARETIDIEHCYFITDPALRRALGRAVERGVRVRILTNSLESIDHAVIMRPILMSAESARRSGAEIYLWRGDLLHSKFMIVDGLYSAIGSYNIMPRSHIVEEELLYGVLDRDFARRLLAAFEADIARAERAEGEIEVPGSLAAFLTMHWFYDQL